MSQVYFLFIGVTFHSAITGVSQRAVFAEVEPQKALVATILTWSKIIVKGTTNNVYIYSIDLVNMKPKHVGYGQCKGSPFCLS